MHVLLLKPPQVFARWVNASLVTPPIGLAYVAAAVRDAGFETSVLDASGEAPLQRTHESAGLVRHGLTTEQIVDRISRSRATVLGVSVMFSHDWPITREIIAAIKTRCPHLTIIAGGEHVSAIPELCLEQCAAIDICVIGEGEATMAAVLVALRDGTPLSHVDGIVYRAPDGIARTARRDRVGIDTVSRPAWDLFPLDAYLSHGMSYGVNRGRTMPILASRGCPYECTFCSSPTMWTTKWTARPVDDVIAEMADMMARYQVRCFDFHDLTTIIRRDWILEFSKAIVDRGWDISWQMPAGTRSEALDHEVLTWLVRSGHHNAVYAPESGSRATLKSIKKQISLERMTASIREAAALGLSIKVNFIMGLPTETWRDLWATSRLLMKFAWIGVDDTFVSCFTVYPGSALFTSMRADGLLPPLDDDYFRSLASIASLTMSRSSSPHLSSRMITTFRVSSMVAFYAVSLGRNPKRLLRIINNVRHDREESRLELGLNDLKDRLFGSNRP